MCGYYHWNLSLLYTTCEFLTSPRCHLSLVHSVALVPECCRKLLILPFSPTTGMGQHKVLNDSFINYGFIHLSITVALHGTGKMLKAIQNIQLIVNDFIVDLFSSLSIYILHYESCEIKHVTQSNSEAMQTWKEMRQNKDHLCPEKVSNYICLTSSLFY